MTNALIGIGIILASMFVPVFLMVYRIDNKINQQEDERGDFVDQAKSEGPDDTIKEMLEDQRKIIQDTDQNILSLEPREIFALLGMSYNGKLTIDGYEHQYNSRYIEVYVNERLKKFGGIPLGWYHTTAMHVFELDIKELDNLLGEKTINVNPDGDMLRALGISSYEKRTEKDVFGDEIEVAVERVWEDNQESFRLEERRVRKGDPVIEDCDELFSDGQEVKL